MIKIVEGLLMTGMRVISARGLYVYVHVNMCVCECMCVVCV